MVQICDMIKLMFTKSVFFILVFISLSWGFFGHKLINEMAIYAIPPSSLLIFLKSHREEIIKQSVNPDKRRHMVDGEAAKHYLDADLYEQALPLDTIPRQWKLAVEKFSEDTLLKHGICPWHLERLFYRLSEAFATKNLPLAIKLCAESGHYIGDLHVPLHSTRNYNGQLSGQHGIHALWESRLPELFSSDYQFYVGRAEWLPSVRDAIWDAFEASVGARDSVLSIEKRLSDFFSPNERYEWEQKGQAMQRIYSRVYAARYHHELNQMVERRMIAAIRFIANYWYSAWLYAGSPDLGETIYRHDTLEAEREQPLQGLEGVRLEPE